MTASLAALAYLVSGVLFILSLRGLSSPETSRRGNTFGMVGMALAIAVTLITLGITGALDPLTLGLIAGGVIVGGGAGALIAARVQMTQMPQLVAAFHSLVGLAACLVAVGAVYAPVAFGIATPEGGIKTLSIIELSLGVAIGAITFTGSVIAFAKLNDEQREALILVGASGFSYEEAADMCGVAVGTIKSRTNRARARLAELMHLNADEALEMTDGATMAVVTGNRPASVG